MTQFKNRIHSILRQNGFTSSSMKEMNSEIYNRILKLPLTDIWMFQLQTWLKQLEALEKETQIIKQKICEFGYQLYPKEIELLLSIKGFSSLTAIALMTDIVDINRFPSVKKFCAYLRTAPKVKSSNEKTVIGSTNRYSRSLTCTLMAQSVEHFAKTGDYLGAFYERVKKGKKPSVSRMALIRKTLVCAYYMLKKEQLFYWVDDRLYQSKLREFKKSININPSKNAA